ncbi:MAG: heparinase II/III family protein [Bacteroidota bacterium]
MRILISIFLIPLLFTTISAQDITKKEILNAIAIDQLQHPYVFFNKKGVEEIRNRINNDQESRKIMDRLLVETNLLLARPVDPYIPPRGTNVRAGWTETDRANSYERKMINYAHNAEKLAFIYQITQEEKYAQKAFEFAEVVCKMPIWILQAHEFSIIYSRVMPWNVKDDQVNFNFDIRTSTLGQSIALVYDWTYSVLTKPQRDRIRGALLEKVITPVRGDYEFHWWATSYRCNWTGVCNGGLGVTALALLKDHPSLADVVAESYNRINKMMNEIGIDGGWQEGDSYLRYGMSHSAHFAIALKHATQSRYNLFENKRLKANPFTFPVYTFAPPNRSVDFGDSSDKLIGGTSLFNLMSTETQSAELAWYRNKYLGEGRNLFDLIFPRPKIEGKMPTITSKHFRTIDWWVMRSDFVDPNKVTLAGKAGRNDDPHHGHLDIGHFLLYWKGQAFLKDLGKPYYDEKYFDQARWDYPQAGSVGHNVIMVNGEQQISGKLKDQAFNYDIGGKVLDFRTSQQRDYVLMDPTNAYPKKELKKWHRHIILEKPAVTIVLDEIETHANNAEVKVQFHSEAKVNLHQNKMVLLEGEGAKMALIPFTKDDYQCYEGLHAYQPVHATRSFEWLPYFGVQVNPTSNKTLFATLILPIEDEQEALKVKQSLQLKNTAQNLTVNFKYDNKPYNYEFVMGDNGWKFK